MKMLVMAVTFILQMFYFKCYFYTLVCREIASVADVICSWKPTLNKVSCILHIVSSADPDQTPHNAASDQGIHCLFTKYSIKI